MKILDIEKAVNGILGGDTYGMAHGMMPAWLQEVASRSKLYMYNATNRGDVHLTTADFTWVHTDLSMDDFGIIQHSNCIVTIGTAKMEMSFNDGRTQNVIRVSLVVMPQRVRMVHVEGGKDKAVPQNCYCLLSDGKSSLLIFSGAVPQQPIRKVEGRLIQ